MKGRKRSIFFLTLLLGFLLHAATAAASEVIIIGDTRLKPVSDIVAVIRDTIPRGAAVYPPGTVRGKLEAVVRNEGAKVVVALGSEALDEALSLPESVPVVYGLVLRPLRVKRGNVSGIYLSTPVAEYLSFLSRYFPGIRKIGIVQEAGGNDPAPAAASSGQVSLVRANNSYEFIRGISLLGKNVDAILLFPDKNLLTATSVEEMYRHSFTERIPVIGVSEKFVKMGSLFALVFAEKTMGRQIGELARKVVSSGDASGFAPSPPEDFDLYINTETARLMKIPVLPELMRRAKKVYP